MSGSVTCFLIVPDKKEYPIYPTTPSPDSQKYKNCPYHICYETTDFEADYEALTANGFIAIDTPTIAPALAGHEVVFLNNAAMGMIELIK